MADTGTIRFIGGLVAEVTIKEKHKDELEITRHPVERGAPITDHAFKWPAQLTIQAGWSALYSAGGKNSGQSQSLSDLYDKLLTLQASAQLIEVMTGKRLYQNMLIRSVQVETDQETENALLVTADLQEVLLVDTFETTMPPAANRATPQSTSGVADTGTKLAIPAPNLTIPTVAAPNG